LDSVAVTVAVCVSAWKPSDGGVLLGVVLFANELAYVSRTAPGVGVGVGVGVAVGTGVPVGAGVAVGVAKAAGVTGGGVEPPPPHAASDSADTTTIRP
jgi:hypothetical protein